MTDATSHVRWGALVGRLARFALLGAGLALAGCQTDGTGVASGSSRSNQALAFESIDGPPKATFDRLVTKLADQAEQQQVALVSRTQPANYRIRGYVSAHTEKGKTLVNYAWDVFDADKQRVARITGTETIKSAKGGAWASCDDEVIARIAGTTIASLSETLQVAIRTPPPAARRPPLRPPPPPDRRKPLLRSPSSRRRPQRPPVRPWMWAVSRWPARRPSAPPPPRPPASHTRPAESASLQVGTGMPIRAPTGFRCPIFRTGRIPLREQIHETGRG